MNQKLSSDCTIAFYVLYNIICFTDLYRQVHNGVSVSSDIKMLGDLTSEYHKWCSYATCQLQNSNTLINKPISLFTILRLFGEHSESMITNIIMLLIGVPAFWITIKLKL